MSGLPFERTEMAKSLRNGYVKEQLALQNRGGGSLEPLAGQIRILVEFRDTNVLNNSGFGRVNRIKYNALLDEAARVSGTPRGWIEATSTVIHQAWRRELEADL